MPITLANLNQAIQKINTEGVPKDEYYLFKNARFYPPHLVLSYANSIANSIPFETGYYTGELDANDKLLLENNGFQLVSKETARDDFYYTIIRFLKKVYHGSNELFITTFQDLRVSLNIPDENINEPYISLLGELDSPQAGLFPLILIHKDEQLLIFALGISDPPPAGREWPNASQYMTIKDYLMSQVLSIPASFRDSLFFSTYLINESAADFGLNHQQLTDDADSIVALYHAAVE